MNVKIEDLKIKSINGSTMKIDNMIKNVSWEYSDETPLHKQFFNIEGEDFELTVTNVDEINLFIDGVEYEGNKTNGFLQIKGSVM